MGLVGEELEGHQGRRRFPKHPTVRVERLHNQDYQHLMELMGDPMVEQDIFHMLFHWYQVVEPEVLSRRTSGGRNRNQVYSRPELPMHHQGSNHAHFSF